jgi:hypothetical protein
MAPERFRSADPHAELKTRKTLSKEISYFWSAAIFLRIPGTAPSASSSSSYSRITSPGNSRPGESWGALGDPSLPFLWQPFLLSDIIKGHHQNVGFRITASTLITNGKTLSLTGSTNQGDSTKKKRGRLVINYVSP